MSFDFGFENEEELEDFAGTLEGAKYPRIQYHTGNTDDTNGDKVKGYTIPVSSYSEDKLLQQIVARMIEAGDAEIVTIEHPTSQAEYVKIKQWMVYPLTLNAASHEQIVKNPRMLSGFVAGTTIDYNKKNTGQKPKKLTYAAMLGIIDIFWKYGYVDENNLPKPFSFFFKGYNGREMSEAVRRHLKYMLTMRDAKWSEKVGMVPRKRVDMFMYGINFTLSLKPETRGTGPADKQKKCFKILYGNSDEKLWNEALEKKLYCGDDKYAALWQCVYEKVGSSRVPGGISLEYAKETMERHMNIMRELDPNNKLPYGTFDVPASWLLARQLDEQADLRRAVQGEAEPVQDTRTDIEKELQTYAWKFKNDPQGKELVKNAREFMSDATMDEEQKEVMVAEVLEALAKRETEIGVPF